MMHQAKQLCQTMPTRASCQALGIPRSSFYRWRQPRPKVEKPARVRTPARALQPSERTEVRHLLNSERFCDQTPRQVWACLLDEGRYYCHWRTMYRILDDHAETRERRNVLRHPVYHKPELLATGANMLWSWDITKLRGPSKGVYYHLYVILDVYSRYVVGWSLAAWESAEIAEALIETSCQRQGIDPGQLTIHADRGPSMTSNTVAELMVRLGVCKTHSRPHVSNDNPYSEAQFKTMKYRPDYPHRFGSQPDARHWCHGFMHWYNHEHYHSGLGLLTPAMVHFGEAEQVRMQRRAILEAAYRRNPERFVRGLPVVVELPSSVWINKPETKEKELLLRCGNVVNKDKCGGMEAVVHISTTQPCGSSNTLGSESDF